MSVRTTDSGDAAGRFSSRATTNKGHARVSSRAASVGRGDNAERARSPRGNNAFMRYAGDNRVVQSIYDLTTGPLKPVVIIAVLAVVLVSIYFPVRDYYVAYRTSDILARQLELRESYNERLESDVDQLLSTEGIEAAARENLGLVMPGEKKIDVVGADALADGGASSNDDAQAEAGDGQDAAASEDAGAVSADDGASGAQGGDAQDSAGTVEGAAPNEDAADGAGASGEGAVPSEPANAQELEDAERAVALDAPWYINVLDTIFFYEGVDGQTVKSTGE